MSRLFASFAQRSLVLRNRIAVSPMCQYSATDGLPGAWHLVHLGSRAVGGAGVVMAEATAVSPEGRISPSDTGMWNVAQAEAWAPITAFLGAHGAVPAVQLAHAGRKASTRAPWEGRDAVPVDAGGWQVVAPSVGTYDAGYPEPAMLDAAGIDRVIGDFRAAAQRALEAGFELVEIHAAHGYLLHQFLSPLTNRRDDAWGGGFEQRIRLTLEVITAVREVWPERLPLWLRISATDWAEGGWDPEQSIALCRRVRDAGVDLVDVSSGGLVPWQRIELGPGYQVPFAGAIRRAAGIATGAVGLITSAAQAEDVLAREEADMVLLGRELLRDPYFPQHAARELGVEAPVPVQYARAW
ncbi:NADH:flavin oxidoreductase/NADH oxidase [Luteimonas yindakuii]|uniref:NADH:flavin oxidoreductase/NADH oxidase n=1 Tax=Luteimonas yindakuii TaxID=2565782 RepID=A0A4Z1R457_9GAMM|nr:NADH:flavin oxidoreductase/NADH oxidase [Luteimonas yindakuii]TKS53696.1 NADH:flavin oxidoreductase/NADH oxidase [Luteimonas yindakuii]